MTTAPITTHRRLEFPAAPAISPYAEETHHASLLWASLHGMLNPEQYERLDEARIGWLAARTYPHLPRHFLRLLSDWHLWLYAMDDGYVDRPPPTPAFGPGHMVRMAARLSRIAADPSASLTGGGRCAAALRDVRRRVGAMASTARTQRWSEAVSGYLMGVCWEATNNAAARLPELAEYTAMRRLSSGLWTALHLIDAGAACELPDRQLADPALDELADLAANLVCWDNDYCSYAKETRRTGARHNLIRVLAAHHACGADEAMRRYVALRAGHVARFTELEAALADRLTPEGARYVQALKHWIRGHLDDFSHSSSHFA
ncbi:hypothetical protein CTZ27_12095 [Streptomyces griseocarneus]|nr:hypothetical protein CTZ27_12095 [Streptomyces griseocarneus]